MGDPMGETEREEQGVHENMEQWERGVVGVALPEEGKYN